MMIKTFTTALFVLTLNAIAQIPSDSLSIWLRADSNVTITSGNVSQWGDLSGLNRVATGFGTPQLITNELCSKPVVRFSFGCGFTLPYIQSFPEKRGTIFVVAKCNGGSGGGNYGTFLSTYGLGSGITWQFGAQMVNPAYGWYDGVGSAGTPITYSPPSQWGIITATRNSDTNMDFYKNGVLSANHTVHDNQASLNQIQIGYGLGEYLYGDIAEIIIYNRSLNASEIYQVNTYLANRYCFNTNVPQPVCQNQTSCGPSSFSLTATNGYRYKWYDNITSLQPIDTSATYITPVLLTSDTFYVANYNDTLESVRTQVIANVLPSPSTPTISIISANLFSTPANAYQWFLNGSLISGANSQSYTPQQNGFYTVQITDANNCTAFSQKFNYTITGLDQVNFKAINTYPNPSNGEFYITSDIEIKKAEIMILNIVGETIYSETLTSFNSKRIDLNHISKGCYTLQIDYDGQLLNKKIVIY